MDYSAFSNRHEIYLQSQEDVFIKIDLKEELEFKESLSAILDVLQSQETDLMLYLRFALECAKKGMEEEFQQFLDCGLKKALGEIISNSVLNLMGTDY